MTNNTTAGLAVIKQNILPSTSAAGGTFGATSDSHFEYRGTFVANGATAVTVVEPNITANSTVVFGLNTVGGTPAGAPYMATVTPGTGFTVKAVAGDTSTYNYKVFLA